MSAKFIDTERILSENAEWTKLDQDWGTPIDLDEEQPKNLKPTYNCVDTKKSTFDSSFLFQNKKLRKKVARNISKRSTNSILDYKDFIQDLTHVSEKPTKQFYFVNGGIISAVSVEEICDEIDDVFKSIEKLCSVTSTVKKGTRPKMCPEIVHCSFSISDLSFDESAEEDMDKYIDEAFNDVNSLAAVSKTDGEEESVMTLVKKFSKIMNSPKVKCNPRKKRECSDKFRELEEFWKQRTLEK